MPSSKIFTIGHIVDGLKLRRAIRLERLYTVPTHLVAVCEDDLRCCLLLSHVFCGVREEADVTSRPYQQLYIPYYTKCTYTVQTRLTSG